MVSVIRTGRSARRTGFTRPPPRRLQGTTMSEQTEHLDVGGGTDHPVLNKVMVASTGVAVGALMVSVGPGLLMGRATQPPVGAPTVTR